MIGSLLLCALALATPVGQDAVRQDGPVPASDRPAEDTVASVSVSPDSASLSRIGDVLRLGARARSPAGDPVRGVDYRWSSSDPSVVTVGTDGTVTARGTGTARIVAAAGGEADTASVTVDLGLSAEPIRGFRRNEPAGYVVLTEDGHGEDSGWSYQDQAGTYEIARPPGEPDVGDRGAEGVFRTIYPGGMTDGLDAANAWRTISADSVEAFYWAYTVRLSEDWENNDNLTKHALWFWGSQIGGHLDFISGADGTGPIHLGITMKSPSVVVRLEPDDRAAARVSRGVWHQIELQVVADTATGRKDFRVWLDGELVLEELGVPFDDEGPHLGDYVSEFKYANTYGGGGQDVPHRQLVEIGHTYISGR